MTFLELAELQKERDRKKNNDKKITDKNNKITNGHSAGLNVRVNYSVLFNAENFISRTTHAFRNYSLEGDIFFLFGTCDPGSKGSSQIYIQG